MQNIQGNLIISFSRSYTSFHPCTNFIIAKFHDIARHTWAYLDTQGLLGLVWSVDQNFGPDAAKSLVHLSPKKILRAP
jgi:hypothetical protein